MPIQAPWVDVRSIGAGGGSIAEIDAGGLLRVGPRSAGCDARAGLLRPRRYGADGNRRRIRARHARRRRARRAACSSSDELAARPRSRAWPRALRCPIRRSPPGIMRVAAAHMVDAIHEITVERGLDPRDGALMAFGGAGGLFATLLAEESGISTIVIPPSQRQLLRLGPAWRRHRADRRPDDDHAARTMQQLGAAGARAHRAARRPRQRPGRPSANRGRAEAALDLRYTGQEYSLTIDRPDRG